MISREHWIDFLLRFLTESAAWGHLRSAHRTNRWKNLQIVIKTTKKLLFLNDIQQTWSLIHVCWMLVKAILHLISPLLLVAPPFLALSRQDTSVVHHWDAFCLADPRHSPTTISEACLLAEQHSLFEGPLLLTLNKKSGTSVKFLSTQIFVLFPGTQNTQDWHWHISCVVSASLDYQGIAKQTWKLNSKLLL